MNKKFFGIFEKFSSSSLLQLVGVCLLIITSIIFVWQGEANSLQAIPATPVQVYFAGEYRIGDGDWKEIVKGEHIPATKGDVTLKGNFHMLTPSGEYIGVLKGKTPIAFYTDHINLSFYEEGNSQPYVIDHENPLFGESACGVGWTAHSFLSGGKTIEIVVHNPHNFGNEKAIDQMLSNMALWANVEFEKGVLDSGAMQRNTGLVFMLASILFLGTALFSSLIHVRNSKNIWLLGLVIFFAGIYFTYSSVGISFWGGSTIFNTMILGVSMMLYMFFLSVLITSLFKVVKKLGIIVSAGLGVSILVLLTLSMSTNIFFYDTWLYWTVIQSVANLTLLICIAKELICVKGKDKLVHFGGFIPLLSFGVDSIATWLGIWEGGMISRFSFIILFIMAMFILVKIIPKSINAVTKAKELENEKLILNTQLAESRVSTMMSQIRPHFIYNTLGSIEQLCELDPPKAGELVHNFAKYLRGNFRELDNPKPILMSQEMEHVHYYINIEKVRFPDMTFTFEMNSIDFNIPALTVQPIVENAVKHGLMKLQKGGTIKVLSYETEENYCVSVEDDGVGFDTNKLIDDRKHVGIRNISERLKAMVNGKLEIESTIGEGTKVLITIPKEVLK